MNIRLESPINKYYVQTLGMIFFPGERFGEDQSDDETVPSLYVKTERVDQGILAYSRVEHLGRDL